MYYVKLYLLFFLFTACVEEEIINNDFFYNTFKVIKNEDCNGFSNSNKILAYRIKNSLLYECNCLNKNSTFFISSDKDSILKKIEFENSQIYPWTINYNDSLLIGFEYDIKTKQVSLVSVDIEKSKKSNILFVKNRNIELSEHPLSEDNKIVYKSNGVTYLYDFTNSVLQSDIFKCSDPPVISKDGKNIVYLYENKVFIYNVTSKKSRMISNLKKLSHFSAFRVFFKNEDELIVKGIKYQGVYFLESADYFLIKNQKNVRIKKVDFMKGFKYH